MKVFLHTWSLAKELLTNAVSLYDLPVLAQKTGFDGLEWLDRFMPDYAPNTWQRLAESQKQAGFKTSALSLCLELTLNKEKVREQVGRSLRIMDLCPLIGVTNIRVSVGGQQWSLARALFLMESFYTKKQRDQRPIGWLTKKAYACSLFLTSVPKKKQIPCRVEKDILNNVACALKPLAAKAKELGMIMGIENHFGITLCPEDLVELVESTNFGTGICLDLGNFCDEKQRLEAVKLFLPKIAHIHFKTYNPNPKPQAMKMNYPEIVRTIKQHNYKGIISVEYEGLSLGLKGAQNGAKLLREIWSSSKP